jgi:hypothetical protein
MERSQSDAGNRVDGGEGMPHVTDMRGDATWRLVCRRTCALTTVRQAIDSSVACPSLHISTQRVYEPAGGSLHLHARAYDTTTGQQPDHHHAWHTLDRKATP